MLFKSSSSRLARLFRRSRDLWKQRAAAKQRMIKRLRITVRDVTDSRDYWKAKAQRLQQQLDDRAERTVVSDPTPCASAAGQKQVLGK